MRKIIAFVMSVVMMLSLAACGKHKKSEAAKQADDLILSIGTVSIDSETAIIKAEEAVAALNGDDMKDLENYDLLKTKRSEYDALVIKVEEERVLSLVTDESWYGVYEGDEYSFKTDGTGSHAGTTLTYKISDGTVNVSEGAAGTINRSFTIDESGKQTKLVEPGNDEYYVRKKDYSSLSVGIRMEYIKVLTEEGYWQFHTSGLGNHVMLYTFSGNNTNDKNTLFVTSDLFGEGYITGRWEFVDNNTIKISYRYNEQDMTQTCDIAYVDGVYKLLPHDSDAYATHKSF